MAKPKLPEKGCAYCATRRLPVLQRVFSRVYAEWECPECGGHWRTDAVTGKLIARLSVPEQIEGAPSVKKQSGQGMVEYAFVLAFLVAAVAVVLGQIGPTIRNDFFKYVVPGISYNEKGATLDYTGVASPSPTNGNGGQGGKSCQAQGKGSHCTH
jgi:hypothetical protein